MSSEIDAVKVTIEWKYKTSYFDMCIWQQPSKIKKCLASTNDIEVSTLLSLCSRIPVYASPWLLSDSKDRP